MLLIRGFDPHDSRPPWWFTPGGGVDDGETDFDAACRELWEETGYKSDDLVGPVWHRTADFTFLSELFRQEEVFYFLRVPHFEPSHTHWTAVELESMIESRWWDITELEDSGEKIYPKAFVAELRRLLSDGLPVEPIDVGGD